MSATKVKSIKLSADLIDAAECDISKRIDTAIARLQQAIDQYQPVAVFGLFSGGHDSLTATYITSRVKEFTSAVHINTGIGVPATRDFVRSTCEKRIWPLLEYRAAENVTAEGEPDPMIYEELVVKHGFPGAFGHKMMYSQLKERQLRRLERDFKASAIGKEKQRVLYVSGCRSEESQRRMGNTQEVQVDGCRIWCAPIHDFTKIECGEVLKYANLERNPVVDLIHKSGECLCGAFASEGELEELRMWYPETAAEIDRIEQRVRAAGYPWGWQDSPPEFFQDAKQRGQMLLSDVIECEMPSSLQHLCWSCGKK